MKLGQNKIKLQLKKQAISNLSAAEMKNLNGGQGDADSTVSSKILCFTWCVTHTIYNCVTMFTCTISIN
jgi:hypothetical protein